MKGFKASAKLLKALTEVKPGDFITVAGRAYRVDEVADCDKDGEKWKNLVYHASYYGGSEIALEIEGRNLGLWYEDEKLGAKLRHHPRVLNIAGEKIIPTEYRQKARMISSTVRGKEELELVYSVYEGKSGLRWAVEDWGEGLYAYSGFQICASLVHTGMPNSMEKILFGK